MATVTDLRPINGEYETLYRVNQELKGEKQAYKRLSKEHLWTIFKMAIGALAAAVGGASIVALSVLGLITLPDFLLYGEGLSKLAIGALLMLGGSCVMHEGAFCMFDNSQIHEDQLREKQSRKETIQRLKAESKAIANNIKASA